MYCLPNSEGFPRRFIISSLSHCLISTQTCPVKPKTVQWTESGWDDSRVVGSSDINVLCEPALLLCECEWLIDRDSSLQAIHRFQQLLCKEL